MKTKNASIVLLSLIVLTACGSKNSRKLDVNQPDSVKNQGKFFDLSTAEVINTVTTNSSVGKTQLIVVAGNPQAPVSLQLIGQMNYQVKKVDYVKGEKGNPEPQIKNTVSNESFPVYFGGKNDDVTILYSVAQKTLTPFLTPTNFKKDEMEYRYAKESRCVAFEKKPDTNSWAFSIECEFLSRNCVVNHNPTVPTVPASNYENTNYTCTKSMEDFSRSETVSNSLDSDSLIVSINPEQSSVELLSKVKKNNKTFLATSLLTFQENMITFKLIKQPTQ